MSNETTRTVTGLCLLCMGVGTLFDGRSPIRTCHRCNGSGKIKAEVIVGSPADEWYRRGLNVGGHLDDAADVQRE